MSNYIVLSEKQWNADLPIKLQKVLLDDQFILINRKEDFVLDKLDKIQPKKIFIPHWSYIIPEHVFEKYECIVFHMTDLPYGRGGSPLQNLIKRGHSDTRISAIRVVKELDAGPIYIKGPLSLFGTAEEIFMRANDTISEMIIDIIKKKIEPKDQEGRITIFKRRTQKMSTLDGITDINVFFNHVRMLDAEGYPKAFFENEHFKFEFSRASLKADKTIIADVRVIKK